MLKPNNIFSLLEHKFPFFMLPIGCTSSRHFIFLHYNSIAGKPTSDKMSITSAWRNFSALMILGFCGEELVELNHK